MDKKTFSAGETSLRIGISKSKTLQMLDRGEIPAIRIGRNWLVPEKALDEWLVCRAYKEADERRQANAEHDRA